jgi:hypothetical protein
MPHLGQHAADDVLAPLVQGDLHERLLTGLLQHPEPVRDRHPVLQVHARGQPPADILRHRAGDLGEVRLGDLVARVGEPVREFAVVGEEHQAFGVVVEPADVEEPFGAVAEVIGDRGAAAVVRHGGQHLPRLVERQVHDVLADRNSLAVDADDLGLRVDAGAEPADDLPVDLDPPLADELLAVPPAADACGGKNLLQPDAVLDVDQVIAIASGLVVGVLVIQAHAAQGAEPGPRLR